MWTGQRMIQPPLQLLVYLAAHGGGENGREDVGPAQLVAAAP